MTPFLLIPFAEVVLNKISFQLTSHFVPVIVYNLQVKSEYIVVIYLLITIISNKEY